MTFSTTTNWHYVSYKREAGAKKKDKEEEKRKEREEEEDIFYLTMIIYSLFKTFKYI